MIINQSEFNAAARRLHSSIQGLHSDQPLNARQSSQVLSEALFDGEKHASAIQKLKSEPKTALGAVINASKQGKSMSLMTKLQELSYAVEQTVNMERYTVKLAEAALKGIEEALGEVPFKTGSVRLPLYRLHQELNNLKMGNEHSITVDAVDTEEVINQDSDVKYYEPSFCFMWDGNELSIDNMAVVYMPHEGRMLDDDNGDFGGATVTINGDSIDEYARSNGYPEDTDNLYAFFEQMCKALAVLNKDVAKVTMPVSANTMNALIADLT
ncbi:hypothetical protein [Vibrio owensii]|uniref:hypothetical protein n=1 Tax=Vibrio owensii TaxID=696485 RepID=UPI003CC5CCDF